MSDRIQAGNEVRKPAIAPSEVMARFLQIHRYLSRYSRRIMRDLHISGRTLAALRYLENSGEATIGQLSRYLYVRSSSVSEMVSKMEGRELVRRVRCQHDNRVVKVSLTDVGRDVVARAPLAGFGLLRERVAALDEGELVYIGSALDRIAGLLDLDADGNRA